MLVCPIYQEKYIDIFDTSEEIHRKIIQVDKGIVYWYKYK